MSYFWNFGSMLGLIYIFQVISGIMLVFYYSVVSSFFSVNYIMFEVNYGWVFRIFHFNFVSYFFLFIFFHMLKGMFFFSYRLKEVWFMGVIIMILLMLIAFLGYVLIFSQMSLWAGIVISSLISVLPKYGFKLMIFIWGGYIFGENILKLFFFLHFILPFFLLILIFLHIYFLHIYGSTNKLFMFNNFLKVDFNFYYLYKDLININFIFMFLMFLLTFPFKLGDSLLFEENNNLVSPIHIIPEWYFLFAYCILRVITNKTLGVFLLLLSVLIFMCFVSVNSYNLPYDKVNKKMLIIFIFLMMMLTKLGSCPAESVYLNLGLKFCFMYFMLLLFIFFNLLINKNVMLMKIFYY